MSTQPRNSDGRYAELGANSTCRCGHPWSEHTSAAPHTCIADGCDSCACKGFVAARSRRAHR